MNEQVGNQGQEARLAAQERAGEIMRGNARSTDVVLSTVNNGQQLSTLHVEQYERSKAVARDANGFLAVLKTIDVSLLPQEDQDILAGQIANLERTLDNGGRGPSALTNLSSNAEIVNNAELHAKAEREFRVREEMAKISGKAFSDFEKHLALGSTTKQLAATLVGDILVSRSLEAEVAQRDDIALAFKEGYDQGFHDGQAGNAERPFGVIGEATLPKDGLPIGEGEEITDVAEPAATNVLGLPQ